MGIRTVRLDDRSEGVLAELQSRTGLSISEVLRRSLEAYAASTRDEMTETPYEIFRRLDLGPGGYAAAPAAHAKNAVGTVIGKKHGR